MPKPALTMLISIGFYFGTGESHADGARHLVSCLKYYFDCHISLPNTQQSYCDQRHILHKTQTVVAKNRDSAYRSRLPRNVLTVRVHGFGEKSVGTADKH